VATSLLASGGGVSATLKGPAASSKTGGSDFDVRARLSSTGTGWGRQGDTRWALVLSQTAFRIGESSVGRQAVSCVVMGDGQLPRADPEQLTEEYCSAAGWNFTHITADYQFISHVHAQF
jgi:hypothetical protein